MAQTTHLLTALKALLKSGNKTYGDVANCLDVSESTVKRMFAEENISLSRLDLICQMLDMEISDIVRFMERSQHTIQELSEAQETQLVSDVKLLMVAVCVLNHWTIEDLQTYNHLSEVECIKYLTQLDKLKIIQLEPLNKIKLCVAPNFHWREKGPIQTFFQAHIGKEFFSTTFDREDECLLVLNGALSLQSNGEFQRKLKKLVREFSDLNQEDSILPQSKKQGVTVVLAMRGWAYGLFKPFIKN